jgi:hypothetical protein
MIEVSFEHWRYEFSKEDLQYGSPANNSEKNAKAALRTAVKKAKQIQKGAITFTRDQILCANEAFPEAAIADPLADLEVWNEWRSGVRIFPHPGKYSRLSITNQLPKGNSPSSIGVIGEIIAGLFGQALISPIVLVRVIKEWPDFIFAPQPGGDGRYAFLEAKARTKISTNSNCATEENLFGISEGELGDCLLNAVRHQNFDPFVRVWYSFTVIQELSPGYRFCTRFLELETPQSERDMRQKTVPKVVIKGLAERAIQKGIYCFLEEKEIPSKSQWDILDRFTSGQRNKKRKDIESILIHISVQQIEKVLMEIPYEGIMKIDRKELERSIEEQVREMVIPEVDGDLGRLLPQIMDDGSTFIRRLGLDSLYKLELTVEERTELYQNWKSDWTQANASWKPTRSSNKPKTFWCFGSAAFALVPEKKDT